VCTPLHLAGVLTDIPYYVAPNSNPQATAIVGSPQAGRISFTFGLVGPSVVVDTACSSAIVALNIACTSVITGASSAALSASVNLILPAMQLAVTSAGMLASDGRCKTFDMSADGYCRAEATAVHLVEQVDPSATLSGSSGVIMATHVGQDGKSSSLARRGCVAGSKATR